MRMISMYTTHTYTNSKRPLSIKKNVIVVIVIILIWRQLNTQLNLY